MTRPPDTLHLSGRKCFEKGNSVRICEVDLIGVFGTKYLDNASKIRLCQKVSQIHVMLFVPSMIHGKRLKETEGAAEGLNGYNVLVYE